MSGKRHKTNKFANFQTITVRNSPAFNHHVLKPLIFGLWCDAPNPLARTLIIALQVVRTSFGFHLLDFMGSSSPPPTQTTFDTSLFNPVVNSFTYMYFGLKDQRIFAPQKLEVIKIFVQFYCLSSYWIDFYQNNFVLKQLFFLKDFAVHKGFSIDSRNKDEFVIELSSFVYFCVHESHLCFWHLSQQYLNFKVQWKLSEFIFFSSPCWLGLCCKPKYYQI